MAQKVCEEVLVVLRKILRAISMQSKQLEQAYGITTPQLLVMKTIHRIGPLAIGSLSREVHLSQATVTAIVDRLERKKLVQRERSSIDRRRVNVLLTDLGKETLSSAPSPIQEAFERAFSRLENWEQTLMLSSLQRVASMMDATDLPAAPLLVEDPQLPGDDGKGSVSLSH
ncbi:MAG: MarR family winged helix-turn-helix transcriptional regulator [Waddliaceae bacterium]